MVCLKVVGGVHRGQCHGRLQQQDRWCAMVTRWGDDQTQKAGKAAPLQPERSQVSSSLISHQHFMNANATL